MTDHEITVTITVRVCSKGDATPEEIREVVIAHLGELGPVMWAPRDYREATLRVTKTTIAE